MESKVSFLQKPQVVGVGKLDGVIMTYQVFYRELELPDFTQGLVVSLHFVHILCQVLRSEEKGTKRRPMRWEERGERSERKHIIPFRSDKSTRGFSMAIASTKAAHQEQVKNVWRTAWPAWLRG